jgi:hypothetical protein
VRSKRAVRVLWRFSSDCGVRCFTRERVSWPERLQQLPGTGNLEHSCALELTQLSQELPHYAPAVAQLAVETNHREDALY